jgi:hypothetical protein
MLSLAESSRPFAASKYSLATTLTPGWVNGRAASHFSSAIKQAGEPVPAVVDRAVGPKQTAFDLFKLGHVSPPPANMCPTVRRGVAVGRQIASPEEALSFNLNFQD